jgi:hypothetical protein
MTDDELTAPDKSDAENARANRKRAESINEVLEHGEAQKGSDSGAPEKEGQDRGRDQETQARREGESVGSGDGDRDGHGEATEAKE